MFPKRWPVLLVSATLLVSACGGAHFVRDDKLPKYKALPARAEVLIVPTVAELPPPVADLGSLWAPGKHGEADRQEIEAEFKATARRAGCDVVAEVVVQDTPQTSLKTVKSKGKDGKPESRQEEVVTHAWKWTARCVRTAKLGPLQGTPASQEGPGEGTPASPGPDTPDRAGPPTPTGSPALLELVTRLEPFHEGYLRGWKDKLRVARPEPADVLDAFAELMVQVTGPAGFWRKTVPMNWLGCATDPSTDGCQRLAAATADFKRWDQVQATITSLGKGQSSAWVNKHHKQLLEYLDEYVPLEPSMSGAQATGFYKEHLQ
jgi:hypothetical protein